ncbi:MAG: hypothetical protein PHN88_05670 [Ignavibacteria bacterium]|nr:hypothetical protein [Ignavibacteria bacterium]
MTFSDKTKDLVLDISSNCKGKLKNIFELSFLIEITYSADKENEFNDLIFSAKYIKGLFNVIMTNLNSELINDSMKDDYSASMIDFKNKLKSLIEKTELKEVFDGKYFGLYHDCMMNLMELIEDLTYTKEYFNSKKFS